MTLSQLVTDPYNRRARLQPALLAILPVFLVALLLYPEVEAHSATLLGVATYFGGAVWLTQLGRERGKKLEPGLHARWGGKPSVAMLRHRDTRLNAPTKARYHSTLGSQVPHMTLPTAEEEANNSAAADETYEAASDWLLANTRDTGAFRLIFEENMNYGFRRNYWALKPLAVSVNVVLILLLSILFAQGWTGDLTTTLQGFDNLFWAAAAVPVLHLVATLLIVTDSWVGTVADAYAQQLLAATDILSKN